MDTAVVGGRKENINDKVEKITATDFIALLYSNRLQSNFKKHCPW